LNPWDIVRWLQWMGLGLIQVLLRPT